MWGMQQRMRRENPTMLARTTCCLSVSASPPPCPPWPPPCADESSSSRILDGMLPRIPCPAILILRRPSLSNVISCAASLNRSQRFTRCDAATFLAWRPSSLYPTLALSWIRVSPCLSLLDSTGMSLAESASEMSMSDSTSRATARSASRRSYDDVSPPAPAPTLFRGLGFDDPPFTGLPRAEPKEWPDLFTPPTSMDALALTDLPPFDRARASASMSRSSALLLSPRFLSSLVPLPSTSANESVTSSSDASDPMDVLCRAATAGFFSGTGKRSSSLACPADGGMDSRRSAAVITFGLDASTSWERVDDSAPVSVCEGVDTGESVGDPPDIVSSAVTTGSPSNPSTPKNVCRDSSRRMPRPCIAERVCPCSGSYCSSAGRSSASSAPFSVLRREPPSRLLLSPIFVAR
mmetsp:Transcript_8400/g.33866  ORF Transcript_8400/g.33866 Transcript_8400/m.33866 type:complete len:408 (-) Transcript_8400:54-1277(-)